MTSISAIDDLRHVDYRVREEGGRLSGVHGITLERHLETLGAIRAMLLERVGALDLRSFHELHSRPMYDVSPAFVIHHLIQHESEHRAEIGRALRA